MHHTNRPIYCNAQNAFCTCERALGRLERVRARHEPNWHHNHRARGRGSRRTALLSGRWIRQQSGRRSAGSSPSCAKLTCFPDRGTQAADALEKALDENAYAGMTDPARFALQLTEQLRAITNDSHMRVIFGSPFRNQPRPATPQDAGFEVKRLDGNIGYIHLARFVPPEVFNPAADDAMRTLSDTAALIIDMRDNQWGRTSGIRRLPRQFLPRSGQARSYQQPHLAQSRDHDVQDGVVLELANAGELSRHGPKTYSAGEEFAYDLQALKRATVVGEKTRGGANPGGLNDLGPDLFVVVPTGRAENPITHGNWGGVGVRLEVPAASENAKEVALALATRRE